MPSQQNEIWFDSEIFWQQQKGAKAEATSVRSATDHKTAEIALWSSIGGVLLRSIAALHLPSATVIIGPLGNCGHLLASGRPAMLSINQAGR